MNSGPYGQNQLSPLPHERLLRWFQGHKNKKSLGIGCGVLFGVCMLYMVCIAIASTLPKQSNTAQQGVVTPMQQPTIAVTRAIPTSTVAPTAMSTPTPQSIQYPPKTVADLRELASKGDASVIHEFHSESVGAAGVCPESKREVTVNPSITWQQLAKDLLAYFYAQGLNANTCGVLVVAYHDQSESGNGYTAGRIDVNVTGSDGTINLDPNARNLKYQLILDTGDIATGQEYTVNY